MLRQAFEGFPREVQSVEGQIFAFERRHDAQRLGVVVEAAVSLHGAIERALAGVAERGMAEVMRQRDRLGQILVEAELAGDRAGDLGDLSEWVSRVRK